MNKKIMAKNKVFLAILIIKIIHKDFAKLFTSISLRRIKSTLYIINAPTSILFLTQVLYRSIAEKVLDIFD